LLVHKDLRLATIAQSASAHM